VIAEYRALDKAQWRYVLEPTKSNDNIKLSLTNDAIKLAAPKK
jgi:predicted component of type VI protein secretion system